MNQEGQVFITAKQAGDLINALQEGQVQPLLEDAGGGVHQPPPETPVADPPAPNPEDENQDATAPKQNGTSSTAPPSTTSGAPAEVEAEEEGDDGVGFPEWDDDEAVEGEVSP